jgi:hypothetical protein
MGEVVQIHAPLARRPLEVTNRRPDQRFVVGDIGIFTSGVIQGQIAIIAAETGDTFSVMVMTPDPSFNQIDYVSVTSANFEIPKQSVIVSAERQGIFARAQIPPGAQRRWAFLLQFCNWTFFRTLARNLKMPGVDFDFLPQHEALIRERLGNNLLYHFFADKLIDNLPPLLGKSTLPIGDER